MPHCFKCKREIPTVKDLIHHLRHMHLLYEPATLTCAEVPCCRTFSRYNSFNRHLATCHFSANVAIEPSPVVCDLAVDDGDSHNLEFDTSGCVPVTNNASDVVASSSSSVSVAHDVDDVKVLAANFLHSLTASSSMTLSNVHMIRSSITELLTATVDKMSQLTSALMQTLQSTSNPIVTTSLQDLERLQNPFEEVDSLYKLDKFISKLPSYVPPVEHSLGNAGKEQIYTMNRLQQMTLIFMFPLSRL